jgi:phosphoglycolate phosphatase
MDLVIFDLDGTLIDSKLDLAHAVNATRAHLELPPLPHELIYSYVGNGAPMLVRRALGDQASEETVERALEFFLAYYRDHMLDHTVLYPCVKETLEKLDNGERRLAVLTNKPVRISAAILDGLGVGGHFFRVYGGNSFEQKKPHPVGIETLIHETGIPKERALMVGDSSVDVLTARNAGIPCCGVTYGFQPEGLQSEPPDFLIERMDQLFSVLQLS